MLFSLYTIKDNLERIKSLHDQTKDDAKEDILKANKNRFYGLAYDLCLAMGELSIIIEDNDVYNIALNNFLMEIENVKRSTTVKAFKDSISIMYNSFEPDKHKNLKWYHFADAGDKWNDIFQGSKDKELKNYYEINVLLNKIEAPKNKELNIFMPDCGSAPIANHLKNRFGEDIKIYGNEAHDGRLRDAKERMHKCVKGVLRGSRISNNVFDILYCQPSPKIEIDTTDIFANKRPEKNYIADMFKYVRDGGVMIFTMPYTRLFKDVCTMMSKHLKNIQIIQSNSYDFNGIGLVHIIGQKESLKEPREEEYIKLRKLYDIGRIITHRELEDITYTLPTTNSFVEFFRGSALDLEEVEQLLDNSNLLDKMLNSQRVDKLDENIKNPLLPFNIGQLGLVLTSGCLDGVVDEGDGYSHLIKGRVSKQTSSEEVEKDGKIEITETTVNKVEINVLLPNGEFKVLA